MHRGSPILILDAFLPCCDRFSFCLRWFLGLSGEASGCLLCQLGSCESFICLSSPVRWRLRFSKDCSMFFRVDILEANLPVS